MNPQTKKVIEVMLDDGKITRLTAMHYGVANVTARIADIRRRYCLPVNCIKKLDHDGNEYGSWYIPAEFRPAASNLVTVA